LKSSYPAGRPPPAAPSSGRSPAGVGSPAEGPPAGIPPAPCGPWRASEPRPEPDSPPTGEIRPERDGHDGLDGSLEAGREEGRSEGDRRSVEYRDRSSH